MYTHSYIFSNSSYFIYIDTHICKGMHHENILVIHLSTNYIKWTKNWAYTYENKKSQFRVPNTTTTTSYMLHTPNNKYKYVATYSSIMSGIISLVRPQLHSCIMNKHRPGSIVLYSSSFHNQRYVYQHNIFFPEFVDFPNQNQSRHGKTRRSTHRFRGTFLDLFLIRWMGIANAMSMQDDLPNAYYCKVLSILYRYLHVDSLHMCWET